MAMLSFDEFVKQSNLSADATIDRYWDNIPDDSWVYVNNETLNWLGYEDDSKGKSKYLKLLTTNFDRGDEYKYLSASELASFLASNEVYLSESNTINSHNKTKHILVSTDSFKQTAMLSKTNRAIQVRMYYRAISKITREYIKYSG